MCCVCICVCVCVYMCLSADPEMKGFWVLMGAVVLMGGLVAGKI